MLRFFNIFEQNAQVDQSLQYLLLSMSANMEKTGEISIFHDAIKLFV